MLRLKSLIVALYLQIVYLNSSGFYTRTINSNQIFSQSSMANLLSKIGQPNQDILLLQYGRILSNQYYHILIPQQDLNLPVQQSTELLIIIISSYAVRSNFLLQSYPQYFVDSFRPIFSYNFKTSPNTLKYRTNRLKLYYVDLPLTSLNMQNRTINYQIFADLPFNNPLMDTDSAKRILLTSVSLASFKNYSISFNIMSTGNTSFTMKVTSPHRDGCVFTQIKVTYFFLPRKLEQQHDLLYTVQSRDQNNTEFRPGKIYFPKGTNNCLLGFYQLSLIDLSSSSPYVTISILNEISGPRLYVVSTNLANIVYNNSMICIFQCLITEYPHYSATPTVCSPCSNLKANCYSCNSAGKCLTCQTGYYLQTTIINQTCVNCFTQCADCQKTNTCSLCSQNKPVKGGCSIDPGCIEVNATMSYLDNSCLACKTGDNQVLVNGVCKCKSGYQEINNLFIIITTGCMTAVKTNYTISCYLCDQSLNFRLFSVNGKCVCKSGYKEKGDSCVQACGDGNRIKHQCDDGNIVSQDGCSNNCQIEVNFDCYGDPRVPSICTYIREDIKLDPISIRKTQFKNEGVFKIKISPKLWIYNKVDASSIVFSTNRSFTLSSVLFQQNYVSIIVDYFEDLQGFPATVKLNLGLPVFLEQKADISFKMISDNSKLIVAENHQRLAFFTAIIQGISWAILALFVISIFVHKMIGLELLQSIQIIYFVHLINSNYTTPFSVFMYLANLGFNFLFHDDHNSNINSFKLNVKFDQSNYNLSQIIIFASIIVPTVLLMIFLLVNKVNQSLKQNLSNKKQQNRYTEGKMENIMYIFYNRVIFPISMGCLFLFFIILGTKNRDQSIFTLFKPALILTTILISIISFIQLGTLFFDFNKSPLIVVPKCDIRYIGFYLLFQLIISVILVSSFTIKEVTPQYFLAPISLFMIILTIAYRPYKKWIHNFGVILCLMSTFSFLLWCIIRDLYPNALIQEEEGFAILFILALITLSIILTLLRVISELKTMVLSKCYKKDQTIKPISNHFTSRECNEPFQIKSINRQENNWKHQHSLLINNNQSPHTFFNVIPQKYFIANPKNVSKDVATLWERKKLLRKKITKQRESLINH